MVGPRAAAEVERRRGPGDVVLDLDAMHAAAGGAPGAGRLVALDALDAARRRAEKLRERVTVWLVHPDATPAQARRYLAAGYELRDTCAGSRDRAELDDGRLAGSSGRPGPGRSTPHERR